MARRAKKQPSSEDTPLNLSIDPAVRENQMIALAEQVAAKRMLDGTVSSQVLVHYLKLATTKYQLELEATRDNNALLKAKTKAVESSGSDLEMYTKAIAAMRLYSGADSSSEPDDDYED